MTSCPGREKIVRKKKVLGVYRIKQEQDTLETVKNGVWEYLKFLITPLA